MKRIFYLLILLIVAINTYAYDFQSGDFYYIITSSSAPYTAKVTSNGSTSNYAGLTTANIPKNVTYNGITYSVTSIGYEAFACCRSLTSVTIPNSVTSIEHGAFDRCSSLTSVPIPNSVTSIGYETFSGCSSLASVTIPNSVTSIGNRAFYGCSALTSVTVPNSVTSIGNSTFYGCYSLTFVTIGSGVTSIGEIAFSGCSSLTSITIPNHVTSIGRAAFANCSSLTSMFVEEGNTIYDSRDNSNAIIETATNTLITGCSNTTIPNSVTSIGDNAFSGCSSLTSVTIPNSVKSIGQGAFSGCSSLTSVTIPNSVTSIGNSAFSGCSFLTSITIPNSVTSIGYGTFSGCSSIASVTIPNSVTFIGGSAFKNCSGLTSITIPNSVTNIGDHAFYGCSALTSVTIPNSVTSIGSSAFSGCSGLTSIIIPNNVTSIGGAAFEDCSGLTSVTIPNSVTTIRDGTFEGCSSLTSVTIPNSVTSIGQGAFRGCSSLTSITIPNSVTSIGISAFSGCSGLTSPIYNAHCFAYMPTAYSGAYAIQDGIKQIAGRAFSKCSELTSVTIPNSVTSIGYHAFEGCSALDTISINAITPPTLGEKALSSVSICYIPMCTQVDYVNSSWNDYVDTFEEHPINVTSGSYGPNIKWKYNDGKLSLFGTGNISKLDCTPWELLIDSIKEIEIENGITNIPADAFSDYTKLNKVILPSSLEEIGANAFANCRRLYEIYSYASIPPLAEMSSFTNYNATLYVPCEHKQYYQSDMVFSLFNKVECITSEEVETDGVIVVPGANNVTITWLKEDGAETYSIVIKKDGEVVCTLTFNSAGQLINIAFAPGRNGNHPAQHAEQVANGKGYRFTVTGLEEGTHYTYNIDVKNTADQTINSHAGEFTTQSTTAVENITTNNANIQKIMRDGQFIIVRDGVEYNAMGQEM